MADPFPSMEDEEAWYNTALWKGNNPTTNISYDAQNKALNNAFEELNFMIRKVTHAFRVLAARVMDEDGIDDEVCAGFGRSICLQ
jgi:hypothetical protein